MDHQPLEPRPTRIVGIVGATGSLQAIPTILSMLRRDFPAPIVVVMAMLDSYVGTFATRLAEKSQLPVFVAEEGRMPRAGNVYVAGTDSRVLIEEGRLRFAQPEPRVYNTMDLLFRSMAREWGTGAVAVIVSGMGADGAAGMKEVRDAGGYTIAQDWATSLVYGKAPFAARLDAICEELPLERIASRLIEIVAPGST